MEQQTPNINRAIMLAVVDEAIEWYVGHPEHYAFDEFEGVCAYRTTDGKKCAVGRWVAPCFMDQVAEMNSAPADEVLSKYPECLQPQVSGLNTFFWNALQSAHDAAALDEHNYPDDDRNWSAARFEQLTHRVVKGDFDNLHPYFKG